MIESGTNSAIICASSCRIRFETIDGAIVMRRKVTINKMEIPAADYVELKKFLSEIARADRCSLILASGPD